MKKSRQQPKKKICPILSTSSRLCECLENGCRMWITVYTTEGQLTIDCAYALLPKMVNGQLRV